MGLEKCVLEIAKLRVGGKLPVMDISQEIVPDRLVQLVQEGIRGHHPLFSADEIRAAFRAPERVVNCKESNEIAKALLAMTQLSLNEAQENMRLLAPDIRDIVIKLYFRLLERAIQHEKFLPQ